MIAQHFRLRLSTLLPALAALFAVPLLLLMPNDAQARERERPRGDWSRYCKDVDVRGDWLEADCRKNGGGWRNNTRINFDNCPGNEVTVRDGHLVCERRSQYGWNGHNNWGNNNWNHGGPSHGGWDDRWDRDRWDGRGHGNYQPPGKVVRDGRLYVWNGRQYVLADNRGNDRDWNRHDWDRRDNDRRDWDRRDNDRRDWDRRDNDRRDNDRRDWSRNDNDRSKQVVRRDDNRSDDRSRSTGPSRTEPRRDEVRKDDGRRDDGRRDQSREEWWKRGNS